jgi:hypothetical protein
MVDATSVLRRVGTLIMVSLPPEVLAESGFLEGQHVLVRAHLGRIEIVPEEEPSAEVTAFADRVVDRYREALRRLGE